MQFYQSTKLIIFIIFLGLLGPARLYGAEFVRILSQSSSGKSYIINFGELDGVMAGDQAELAVNSGGQQNPRIVKMAQLTCVKSVGSKSYWILLGEQSVEKLDLTRPYILLRSGHYAPGVVKRPFNGTRHVYPTGQGASEMNWETEQGMPRELIVGEGDYSSSDNALGPLVATSEIGEMESFENWGEMNSDHYLEEFDTGVSRKFVRAGEKMPLQKREREAKEEAIDSRKSSYYYSLNDLPYGTDMLYEAQLRSEGQSDVKTESTIPNIFEEHVIEVEQDKELYAPAAKRVEQNGGQWSKDFSDEGLKKYIEETGLLYEGRRRKEILEKKNSHEFLFKISRSFNDHTSAEDSENRGAHYSYGIGYEYHFSRSRAALNKWSMDFFGEKGTSFYDIGDADQPINVKIESQQLKVGINYYLSGPSGGVSGNLWYLGSSIGLGGGRAYSSQLSKEYKYQFSTYPSVYLGLKYRFWSPSGKKYGVPIGGGFNGRIVYEQQNLTSEDELSAGDNIVAEVNQANVKLELGLSFYF